MSVREDLNAPTDWKIWVSGYGEFDFYGTEIAAEEMRAHKANWERGQGRKWRKDLARESDKLTAEIVAIWEQGDGVPQSLMSKLKKAKDAEARAIAAQDGGQS